jgi:hypothetical protein
MKISAWHVGWVLRVGGAWCDRLGGKIGVEMNILNLKKKNYVLKTVLNY